MAHELEKRDEAVDRLGGEAQFWRMELEMADKQEDTWRKRGKEIVKRYRDERDRTEEGKKRFNILWSNTETLKANLLGSPPGADIRRRYQSEDDTGREISQLLERAIGYTQDRTDGFTKLEQAVEDMLLPGRGVVRVLYEPTFAKVTRTTMQVDEDGIERAVQVEQDEVVDQEVRWEYVYWEDFRRSKGRIWEDVWWIAFRHHMKRDEIAQFFGEEKARTVPLNVDVSDGTSDDDGSDAFKRAEVWEIWDKDKRERVYVVKGHDELLEKEDDPLGLEGFFPTPRPLYSVSTTSSLVPIPEYTIYQDQASELDRVTQRINAMVEAVKRRGAYDAEQQGLKKLADAGDNEFIPVNNWNALQEKGGLEKVFASEDTQAAVTALQVLYEQRDSVIQTIFEVTGISDIIRGQSDPRETATAQRTKANFGSMRLRKRQQDVQMFVRSLYAITAEIVGEQFEPELLQQITGVQVTPEMQQALKSDKLRAYKIDIETDSTVLSDDQEEKQSRIEFIQAVSSFMQQFVGATEQFPQLAPVGAELLMFGARGFKVGRSVEESLEEMSRSLKQQAQQPQQPSPEERKAQIELQTEQARLQIEQAKAQNEIQRKNAETALKAREFQHDREMKEFEVTHDATLDELKAQIEAENKLGQALTDDEIRRAQAQTDDELRRQKAQTEIELKRRQQSQQNQQQANGQGAR